MKKLKGNTIFFIDYFVFWLADAFLVPYLGLFYVERDLSGAQIAVLSVVEAVIAPISAIVIGFVMNMVRSKKAFFVGIPVGSAVAALIMYYSGNFGGIVVATAAIYFCRTPFSSMVDRVLMARLHDRPEDYGVFRLGGSMGYGVGALIAGVVYAAFQCRPLFFMYVPAIIITGLCCLKFPMEDESPARSKRPDLKALFNVKSLVSTGGFLKIYGTLALFGFITSSAGKYMAVYVDQQGLDSSITGRMIAFAMIGEIIMFLVFPVFSKKFGPEALFFFGFLFYMARSVSILFIASIPLWLVMIMQIIGGAEFSVMWAAATSMVEANYPPESGFLAHTLKSVFNTSIGYGLGCVLLSVFYDLGQMKAGFGVLTAVNAICLVGYALLAVKAKKKAA